MNKSLSHPQGPVGSLVSRSDGKDPSTFIYKEWQKYSDWGRLLHLVWWYPKTKHSNTGLQLNYLFLSTQNMTDNVSTQEFLGCSANGAHLTYSVFFHKQQNVHVPKNIIYQISSEDCVSQCQRKKNYFWCLWARFCLCSFLSQSTVQQRLNLVCWLSLPSYTQSQENTIGSALHYADAIYGISFEWAFRPVHNAADLQLFVLRGIHEPELLQVWVRVY